MILFLAFLGACSNDATNEEANEDSSKNEQTEETTDNEEETEDSNEPVTVKFLFPWGEDLFNQRIVPIDEKLPNINIELVEHDTGSTEGIKQRIEELSANNIVPDIMLLGSNELMDDYIQEFIEPLDDLVEKHNFDLNKINPSLIASIRSMDAEGRLISFPNSNDVTVLYYNKEIFDKFGVDYPTDGMTWEEIIDLAKQVTSERDGVEYRGLDIRDAGMFILNQRGINLTDPETGEVLIENNEDVQKALQIIQDIYSIPGNLPPEDSSALNDFLGRKVAMTLYSPQFMRWGIQTKENAETIDFVSAPVWSSDPDVTEPAKSYYHWVINKFSENKDAAFQVLMEYTSEDIQQMINRAGQELTILADEAMMEQFGADLDVYEGKNIPAIYAVKAGDPPKTLSKWNQYVRFNIDEFIRSDKEINQYIREVAEEAEIAIKEAKEIQ